MSRYGARRRGLYLAMASLLVLAGVVVVGLALRAQHHPPQPPAAAAVPYRSSSTASPAAPNRAPSTQAPSVRTPAATGPLLSRAVPVTLTIPAIGVHSTLLQLGLNPDHTVEVPPLEKDSRAGWYKYSPTPGQLGPAIILGHVDSAKYGPGVFFKLGALRPGDTLTVERADNTVALFRIDRVVSYPKNHFPTLEVYGNTDHAALRLITCGGKFDFTTRNYENNIVAYATLISSHPA